MSPRLLWLLRQLHPVRGTYVGDRNAPDVMALYLGNPYLRNLTFVRGPLPQEAR